MTENTEIVLRSGKTLNTSTIVNSSSSTSDMDGGNQDIDNTSHQTSSQVELEEKVDGLRDELDNWIRSMLNTLIRQGKEREVRERITESSRNRYQSSSDIVLN